jgi:small subunit ribosomal protein S1
MSWAKRVRHPSEVVKKGDLVDVIVLEISQDKKRISLGMKQLTENPWEQLAVDFAPDVETTGKITRILDRGAVVELRADVEGFVPVGHMGIDDIIHPEQYFEVGEELPLRVIKVDPKSKRIVLSVNAWLKDQPEEDVKAFIDRHPKRDIEIPVSSSSSEMDDMDDVDLTPAVEEKGDATDE